MRLILQTILQNLLNPFKIILLILAIPVTGHAYDASIGSEDSDSDSVEINPFRQIPHQPTLDIEMETVATLFNGMALEERDSSHYTNDLNFYIQKCQDLHKTLCEMLQITTIVCMSPYSYDREKLNEQFSVGLKFIDFVMNQRNGPCQLGAQIKRYDLPGGEVHYIPSIKFISQALSGAHILTSYDAHLAKSILEYLIPATDQCFKYLWSEREGFHRLMSKRMGY